MVGLGKGSSDRIVYLLEVLVPHRSCCQADKCHDIKLTFLFVVMHRSLDT